MVATTDKLASLHQRLADVLGEYLSTIDTEDTEAIAPNVQVMKLTAAFLKDNNITADLDNSEDRDAVAEKLAALKGRRTVASTPVDMLN